MTAFERFRDKLVEHGSKIADNKQNHFMAQCPAHKDGRPSLGVDYRNGSLLVRCYADCQTDDVVAALGLELKDLFDGEPGDKSVPVRSYVYRTSRGEPVFIVDRYWPKTFRHRRPDTQPGNTGGIKGIEPILFHADKVWQAMKAGPTTVYLVDGEKDVETAEQHGLVATCPPGFGKTWRASYTQFLKHAERVVIVTDQDEIKPDGTLGKGQQFALAARAALRAESVAVRVVAPAVGKDLSDHFAGGYTADDFTLEKTASVRPRGLAAADLMGKEFEPVEFIIDKILPEGLTIFAGSPKVGKSWTALDICLAVSLGGPAMSGIATRQGNVLYLAREDNYRRLQARIALVMGGDMSAVSSALELVPQEHDWVGGDEGLANLTEWAEEVRTPRLVVMDTIAKVEPEMGEDNRRGAYTGNYSMMARYKKWADQHHCGILMLHHDRKAGTDKSTGMQADPFTKISGTRGLTGAADTLWFLETIRGTKEGELHITGRDVVEQTIAMHKVGPLWTAIDLPE